MRGSLHRSSLCLSPHYCWLQSCTCEICVRFVSREIPLQVQEFIKSMKENKVARNSCHQARTYKLVVCNWSPDTRSSLLGVYAGGWLWKWLETRHSVRGHEWPLSLLQRPGEKVSLKKKIYTYFVYFAHDFSTCLLHVFVEQLVSPKLHTQPHACFGHAIQSGIGSFIINVYHQIPIGLMHKWFMSHQVPRLLVNVVELMQLHPVKMLKKTTIGCSFFPRYLYFFWHSEFNNNMFWADRLSRAGLSSYTVFYTVFLHTFHIIWASVFVMSSCLLSAKLGIIVSTI